jgi:UDP-2-acetamido-3-amino-2,3-dideoxy-glucuronate N-acetyltransferase
MSAFIHPTSVIDENVTIGNNSKIWHFSHVSLGAKIGNFCSLGQNVFVGKNVEIGNHVKIQNNVSIYEGVFLEDYVFCGPSVVFTNDLDPRSRYPKGPSRFLKTFVMSGASIGANATILCGIRIGNNALIAAGSVVTKDVLNHSLVMGVPAKHSSWVCECGKKLNSSLVCNSCNRQYIEKEVGLVEL